MHIEISNCFFIFYFFKFFLRKHIKQIVYSCNYAKSSISTFPQEGTLLNIAPRYFCIFLSTLKTESVFIMLLVTGLQFSFNFVSY